ncbi:MAG: anti-sigma regulatory factor [Clostridiales bacterium]|jgi:serine/threonine-protein kinase RsbT|nr:anti-sigma regulatory factor [Eubacteriales bacterium]MDH7565040.1 anti-sigma regulatory factor [Clostridiales bacterium]
MILGVVEIFHEKDIVIARQTARELTKDMGFGLVDQTRIVTAVSELSRNIFKYAKSGRVIFESVESGKSRGISISFIDKGPGIESIENAMKEGFSTDKGMGLGLPGVKKLMDYFKISSELEKGTTVVIIKWK